MKPFDYHRANSFDFIKHQPGRFLAGGTNLIDLMKHEIETPTTVIDIAPLPLSTIEMGEDKNHPNNLTIGAMVTNAELANHISVRQHWPLLSLALLSGATAQLRNRATTGGNFLQRTRCYYFYDTSKACNKREPGSGCDALKGFNRIHAILGASEHCIATHPSDMAVAMVALDARIKLLNGKGEAREIAAEELHRLPGNDASKDTILTEDELITHVVLPSPPKGKHVYRKVRDRSSYAFALVSVACILHIEQNRIHTVRLALGGVAHKPWRARKAEEFLLDKDASTENFRKAAQIELAEAKGYGHNDFKIPLAQQTLVAALVAALKEAAV